MSRIDDKILIELLTQLKKGFLKPFFGEKEYRSKGYKTNVLMKQNLSKM